MPERPILACVTGIFGSLILIVGGGVGFTASRSFLAAPNLWASIAELTAGAVVLFGSVLLALAPDHRTAIGPVMIAFSLASVFGPTGGFCLGSLLGVFAGLLALIERTGGPRSCPVCGGRIPTDSGVCPACGSKVEVPARPKRPDAAIALAATATFFVHMATVLGAVGPYPFPKFPFDAVTIGVAAEAGLIVGGVQLYRRPTHRLFGSTLLLVSSLAAVAGPYSAFVLGPILGGVGGIVGLTWRDDR